MRADRNPNPPVATPAQRAEVLELAAQVGAAEAARRTGHKATTVRTWIRRASDREAIDHVAELITAVSPVVAAAPLPAPPTSAPPATLDDDVPAAPAVERRPWAARRDAIAMDAGQAAEEALVAVRDAIAQGKSRQARELVVTFGVLVDKVQLLTGAATRRVEETSVRLSVTASGPQVLAEVERLRGELGLTRPAALDATSTEVVA